MKTTKKTNCYVKAIILLMLFTFSQFPFVQAQYWSLGSGGLLQNVMYSGSITVNDLLLNTNYNTRARISNNGKWQINPWSGAGGYICEPSGQADFATFKIRAGGTSGLVSYSFQDHPWGQNIQSYVGLANTVSYVVNWNGADRFYVAGQGWLYANGAWFSSDRKLKDDIKPLENSLQKILKLNGYSYRFKQEKLSDNCDSTTSPAIDEKIEIGLLADEVESVVPEVVRTIAGDKKAIAYQNIVALLIESTKEQQKSIESLCTQLIMIKVIGCILILVFVGVLIYLSQRKKTRLINTSI